MTISSLKFLKTQIKNNLLKRNKKRKITKNQIIKQIKKV